MNNKVLYIRKDKKNFICKGHRLFLDQNEIIDIPLNRWKKYIANIRLFNRIFRLQPRCMTILNNNTYLIVFQKHIYIFFFPEKRFIEAIPVRKGFGNPLHLCSTYYNGKAEVLWGDYGHNDHHLPVNIYRYNDTEGIQTAYTFPAGSIRHIHNIVYDQYHNRYFIFTGDFEKQSGIYTASTNFSEVKPYLTGKQDYRCVIGRALPNGLLYATDAVMQPNHIFFKEYGQQVPKMLCEINGSVIYGTPINDGLLISTTVEPYPSIPKYKILSMFDYRLGKGIKSRDTDIIYISKELQITHIYRLHKDAWPMRLCQYGQVEFPEIYCADEQTSILCSPMSLKKYDGKICKIDLENFSFSPINQNSL